jgi:hypothetical protein
MTVVTPLDTAPPPRVRPGRTVFTPLLTLCAVLAACSEVPAETAREPLASPAVQALSGAPQLSPPLPVPSVNPIPGPTAYQQFAMAAGNGLYLMVWWEYDAASGSPRLFGLRVRASDGAALDAQPFRLSGIEGVPFNPSVAFDGTNFLAVWTSIGAYPVVRGVRVRASDGAVLDPTPQLISRPLGGPPPYASDMLAQRPSVAFDGKHYLVVWDGEWYVQQSYARGPMGIRVRPSDGVPVESTAFPIAKVGNGRGPSVGNPRVAFTNGTYLVAWEQDGDIKAARIGASSGQVLDTVPLSLTASAGAERIPAVAAREGEFLAVWTGADQGLWGRRVKASDGSKLGTTDLFLGAAVEAPAEVVSDTVNYWVAWQGLRGGSRKALVARVTPEGGGAVDAELVVSDAPADGFLERGAIASAGSGLVLTSYMVDDADGLPRPWRRLVTAGQVHVSHETAPAHPGLSKVYNGHAAAQGNGLYLVVWSQLRTTEPIHPEIVGARVRISDGAVLDPSPFSISNPNFTAFDPAVAFDGTNFLVVWSNVDSIEIDGARVRASDGVVLDTPPLPIDRATRGYYSAQVRGNAPSVAFDGTNYLVVWSGGRAYGGPGFLNGIMAIRVRPSDGTRIEADSFLVARIPGLGALNYAPSVTHAAGQSLVAWAQDGQVLAARTSAATGQVLDAQPLSLGTTGAWRTPGVAAQADGFLVVWSRPDNGLWGRRVRASDGAKLGTADLFLGADAQGSPHVAFDGADYRVAWPAVRAGNTKLVTNRVSPAGVTAAETEIVLSSFVPHSSGNPGDPQLAVAGPGRFLVTYSPSHEVWGADVRMRFVSDDSVPACGAGAPSIELIGSAALTLECGPGAYSDLGAQAFDACGRSLPVRAYNTGADSSGPGPNLRNEGAYQVSYTAQDAGGLFSSAVRTVTVDDRTPPTLTLNGAAQMTHTCGSQWVDPGVQATDACYGNLTAQVWRSGTVNGWAVGTYTVTYSLTDSGGNSAAPLTRTVNVVNCPW